MPKFFWDRESHAWIQHDPTAPRQSPVGPYVIGDIEPYRNMLNGQRIQSRRHHRDFIKAHRLIEIGNEYNRGLAVDRAPESPAMTERGRRDAIERAFAQVEQGGGRKPAGRQGDI
ncbi:MAG TPA: hypothetical protein VH184_15890 [Dongiaceae bacterium]|nr:hypothetical protein [Dongiaceae bacterium]